MRRWNIPLQDVRRLLKNAAALELSADSVLRLKWLEYFILHDENLSLTCRHFGIARSTLMRWIRRFRADDLATLEEQSRRPHTIRTPETDPAVIAVIRALRMENPLIGKNDIQTILQERGIVLSASTIGRIITRHAFFFADTESHRQKRAAHTEKEDMPMTHATEGAEPDALPPFLPFPQSDIPHA